MPMPDKIDTAAALRDARKALGLHQATMAERMGMAARAYSDLERGLSHVRPIHARAVERVALAVAVERGDPMLAPASVRRDALALAAAITGRPAA